MAQPTVGFIGLGIMGKPMAENVLDAGYPVVAHNRSRDPVEALVERGATAATTPREVAEQAGVTITVLPDTDAVETVLLGDDGVIEGVEENDVVIDMSTISPPATEEMASELDDAGAEMLDAPISGGEQGAIEGMLSIMVGGDETTFETNLDLFETMGTSATYCGDHGAGQVTKACNQIVVALQMQAVSEALVLAEKAGADLEAVVDAISGGAASCWALDTRAPNMIRGDFDPGFFGEYHYKDLRIAADAGEEFGAPMPAASTAHEMYKSMVETGRGRDDTSGVLRVLEDLAGAEARIE